MFLEIAAGAYLLGNYAYHRWFEDHDPVEKSNEFRVPVTDHGSALPLYFGRVRIRKPVLAQTSPDFFMADTDEWSFRQSGGADFLYGIDMLFALGIGFYNGVNRIHTIWGGELKMQTPLYAGLESLTGEGNYEQPVYMAGPQITDRDDRSAIDYPAGFGLVEFLNGNSEQELVDKSGINLSKTYAGDRLSTIPYSFAEPILGETLGTTYQLGGTTTPVEMPGYRGLTMVFMFNGNVVAAAADSGIPAAADHGAPVARWHSFPVIPPLGSTLAVLPWIVGANPEPPAYSFETSTYPNTSLDLRTVGSEANPADVLWAIYRDVYGKLGLDYTRLDYETFRAVAEQLRIEGHGYSRVWEDGSAPMAGEVVLEVLKQIDGLIYEDMLDGLIKLRLIRADFDPSTLLLIDPNNARLEPVTAAGRSKLVNKLRVVFENRSKDYESDSVTADNGANAFGQSAVIPDAIEFPGIKTAVLARPVASRELAARSIPLAKVRAIVDRRAYRVTPGDRVVLNYPKFNISGMVMIVARATPGASNSNDMALDLIQDFHYTHRFIVSTDTGLPAHPTEAVG